jgi:protein SCO1/2
VDVLDQPALVYFGYTFCPDVCPMDVARNVVAVEILAESGLQVKPVFVTIDPVRDTVDYLADFVANNHSDMIGLTGTAEQVAKAARAYKVYYRKQSGDDEEYYLMDHSSFTYLMIPDIGFVDFLRSDIPPQKVADRVACVINAA